MTWPPLIMLVPYGVCSVAYAGLTLLILAQAQCSRTGLLLAVATGVTAIWASVTALLANPLQGVASVLDLLRVLAWYGFCLHLFHRSLAENVAETLFRAIGVCGLVGGVAVLLLGQAGMAGAVSLWSPGLVLRLILAISQLLLLENLFRGTTPDQQWHVGLACIALGGFAAYDLVLCADAVLLRTASVTLVEGRALIAVLVTPLLAVATARNRNWQIDIHVSRSAVFHTATLLVSGVFLVALASVGEVVRRLGSPISQGWGGLTEVCLVFAGLITVTVLLTSKSARGALRRGVIDHFFTHRYDYRREWQRCIDSLSTVGSEPLSKRVINALADAVDSPSGLLFTREPGQAGLAWAGAWNTPPTGLLPTACKLTAALLDAKTPIVIEAVLSREAAMEQFGSSFSPWLAVPLQRSHAPAAAAMGYILLARPRTAFHLDAEVYDLLRILAHEVSIHLAQERATSTLLETRDLRAYGERFAFVAHDIKNVSSQLSLLLSNAQTYLADPEFQRDMLETVRASVSRISGLIRRLEPDSARVPPGVVSYIDTAAHLNTLLRARRRLGGTNFSLTIEAAVASAQPVAIAMEAAGFEAAITHLLDNAATAAGAHGTVSIGLYVQVGRVVIEITDDGPGMTAEFIRDALFAPFTTRTQGGSGLGAFQARELVRSAGGDLTVQSRLGQGTTMRLSWPLAPGAGARSQVVQDLLPGGGLSPLPQNAA
jgi:putative PEP-CTERM system histidine kinase